MTEIVGGRTQPVQQIPEPSRFWIAYSPRTWRCAGGLWTDLARLDLGGAQKSSAGQGIPELAGDELDDLMYVPPVTDELASARDAIALSWAESGSAVLVQLELDQRCNVQGVHPIHDLLEPLLNQETERFLSLPSGAVTVWPLIPGISDHPRGWEEGLSLLAQAGVECVQPVALQLTAIQRRKLAEGRDDAVFDALFHRAGEGLGEREFAVFAHRQGLKVFMDRPPAGLTPRTQSNREIAAALAMAGELWLRLNRSVALGQALFRAARGAESTPYDLRALVHEDNLKVLSWLGDAGRKLVHEHVLLGASSLLTELRAEYLGEASE